MRPRLADKIGDNMCGLWPLVPEHLRLGTWDLLHAWTRQPDERLEPRLALQLVHEAALCSNGLHAGRCLTARGFETLNIRYGQMTMALIAQTVIHQFRRRLGAPYDTWDAQHLAYDIFRGLDGDIRVRGDTIVVTYYNAPNVERLRKQYEGLPARLQAEGVDPRIPWLYGLRLDFRFK